MTIGPTLDPDNFIDADEVWEDDYNGYNDDGHIHHASFVIVPGNDINHTQLVFWRNGVEHFDQQWGISIYYGYRYNGQDIPISPERAEHILDNLSSHGDFREYEWSAQDCVYVE